MATFSSIIISIPQHLFLVHKIVITITTCVLGVSSRMENLEKKLDEIEKVHPSRSPSSHSTPSRACSRRRMVPLEIRVNLM